ncbi:MAG: hypothetical protein IJ149_07080 [Oscillospiraceae bacterium]|nr:hypothetical protein [Oscillospiraceae bacterium]
MKSENQSVIIAVYALREAGNEKREAGLITLLSSTNSKSHRLLQAKRRTSRQFPVSSSDLLAMCKAYTDTRRVNPIHRKLLPIRRQQPWLIRRQRRRRTPL